MRMLKFKWMFLSVIALTFIACQEDEKDESEFDSTFKTTGYVEFQSIVNGFVLADGTDIATLIVDDEDSKGVHKVVEHLQNDIEMVTGYRPKKEGMRFSPVKNAVIIGTVGESRLIDQLIATGKLDVTDVRDRWEVSLLQVIDKPLDGIEKALVIAGSDKRGTIFGMFDLSAQMGVSPWYWWADVPVVQQKMVQIRPGRYNLGEPKVKYRGIFINDEEPALGNWTRNTFGGFNADFYAQVYELILRMKGNFLWPAMWGKAHADDDPRNPVLAHEYGIVISYTHHEPMMRAHVEWSRYGGGGPWDYTRNKEKLDQFWQQGVQRNLGYESFVTIGMRGDGDEPMSNDRNIEVLTDIVRNQRRIIEEVTGKSAEKTPQVWALYKEVQEYYDMGMRVPDDIMLLYCDDNWGNVRRMPGDAERARAGGLGMYYHFDYVGGPRSYKWINTNPLPKVWEQNTLTYAYGINEKWVVNVGDIKPMEFPIQFYLDLAWDPDRFKANDIMDYSVAWAKQQFGGYYAKEIADFLNRYGKYNGRRKPEMVDWRTYSVTNYREFERVAAEYNLLADEAAKINELLPANYKSAYFQLVLYPIQAAANLYNLYHATARNHFYARQGRSTANLMADSVAHYFQKDSLLDAHYHFGIADGKWNHMMSQTRIGYTYWNQPPRNAMPRVERINIEGKASPGLYVEGAGEEYDVVVQGLPEFDSFHKQVYFLELFNKGNVPFQYQVEADKPWVMVSSASGEIKDEKRLFITVDWSMVPEGVSEALLRVKAHEKEFRVPLKFWKASSREAGRIKGHIESNGYISIESSNYSRLKQPDEIRWLMIPDIGRTLDGVVAQPYTAAKKEPGTSASIEYDVYFRTAGEVKVYAYFSPTLNFLKGSDGLKYGIGFNNESPQLINAHENDSYRFHEKIIGDKLNMVVSTHTISEPGNHTLKYYYSSPGLVLQKLVIDTGGLQKTYLGPEESAFKK
jgi:hypothetical protein